MTEVLIDGIWIPFDAMTSKRKKRMDDNMIYLGMSKKYKMGSKDFSHGIDYYFYAYKEEENEQI